MGISSGAKDLDTIVTAINNLSANVELLEVSQKRMSDIVESSLDGFAEAVDELNTNLTCLSEEMQLMRELFTEMLEIEKSK